MERARELLRHTDLSIINISLECGYGNPAHFATAFRRSVGMSPSDYRAGLASRLLAAWCGEDEALNQTFREGREHIEN
jgi:AraC-like DNA-binding protein